MMAEHWARTMAEAIVADLYMNQGLGADPQFAAPEYRRRLVVQMSGILDEHANAKIAELEAKCEEAHETGRAHQAKLELAGQDRFLESVPHSAREASRKIRGAQDARNDADRRAKKAEAQLAALREAVDVAFVFIASSKPSLGLTLRERFDEVMPILSSALAADAGGEQMAERVTADQQVVLDVVAEVFEGMNRTGEARCPACGGRIRGTSYSEILIGLADHAPWNQSEKGPHD